MIQQRRHSAPAEVADFVVSNPARRLDTDLVTDLSADAATEAELEAALDANDEQLDFPVVYTSAINGTATLDLTDPGVDMTPLFEAIVEHVADRVGRAPPRILHQHQADHAELFDRHAIDIA